MSRPVLLDLFCGAGGAAMGYHRAGFDVVGVDLELQRNYPFDLYQEIITNSNGWVFELIRAADAVHASPPCQKYSQATNMHDKTDYPDMVAEVRGMLQKAEKPYVIENVPGAPLIDPVQLCGSSFGIERLRRHRLFEANWGLEGKPCDHSIQKDVLSVTGHGEGGSHRGGTKRGPYWGQEERKRAMGIDWMNRTELAQAIPPAYTEYIGRQLIEQL